MNPEELAKKFSSNSRLEKLGKKRPLPACHGVIIVAHILVYLRRGFGMFGFRGLGTWTGGLVPFPFAVSFIALILALTRNSFFAIVAAVFIASLTKVNHQPAIRYRDPSVVYGFIGRS